MTGQPYYDLEIVRRLAADPGSRSISTTAYIDAQGLDIDMGGVWKCVQGLALHHFYKTMVSEKFPDLWQDVYKVRYGSNSLYIKVQLLGGSKAHVISFKEDTST